MSRHVCCSFYVVIQNIEDESSPLTHDLIIDLSHQLSHLGLLSLL